MKKKKKNYLKSYCWFLTSHWGRKYPKTHLHKSIYKITIFCEKNPYGQRSVQCFNGAKKRPVWFTGHASHMSLPHANKQTHFLQQRHIRLWVHYGQTIFKWHLFFYNLWKSDVWISMDSLHSSLARGGCLHHLWRNSPLAVNVVQSNHALILTFTSSSISLKIKSRIAPATKSAVDETAEMITPTIVKFARIQFYNNN